MLIAYIDEFGHTGPYISQTHEKYNTHPCFGYGGYVMPADLVRRMGARFKQVKESLLEWEIKQSDVPPSRWEKKGAALLTSKNMKLYGDEIEPALKDIYQTMGKLGGEIFFYGQQKPIGPVSVTKETSQDREAHCLIQAANRLGTLAKQRDDQIFIVMDGTDTHNRERAVATLGATIYSKSNGDNRSIVDIPLQADSHLYGTIQLADWTCALLGRLSAYHFSEQTEFDWAVDLGRELFDAAKPTDNSIVWSNHPSQQSKCFPNQLTKSKPFWRTESEKFERFERRENRNGEMMQKMVDASSPELLEKLNKMGNPEESQH